MRRPLSLLLAVVLAIGVGTAIVASVRERLAADDPPPLTTVRGVTGSEKQPFFRDPAVVAAFARHGLAVQVDLAGSREIATRVGELAERPEAFPPGLADAYVVERTTLDYLPTALERYLNLPRGYANRVPVSGGRTALQVLLAQLALLETQLDEVLDAVAKGDADRLLAHGRFLEDRFGRSQLDLD